MTVLTRYLAYLACLALLIGLLAGSACASPPSNPTATPVPTIDPEAPPLPPFTEEQASAVAQEWVTQNENLLRHDVGWVISDYAATFTGDQVALRDPISAAGKRWLDGVVKPELVWTGMEFTMPPGPVGRWQVLLTSESVTDLEYDGTEGGIKAEVSFLVHGTRDQVEGHETMLSQAILSLEGFTEKMNLDQ